MLRAIVFLAAVAALSHGTTFTIQVGFGVDGPGPGNAGAFSFLKFFPNTLSIDVGDSVTFTVGSDAHTASFSSSPNLPPPIDSTTPPTYNQFFAPMGPTNISDPNVASSSGLMFPGQSYTYLFSAAGQYSFFCAPHTFMTGMIIVGSGMNDNPVTVEENRQIEFETLTNGTIAFIAANGIVANPTAPTVTNNDGSKTHIVLAGLDIVVNQVPGFFARFYPSIFSIDVGDTVSFVVGGGPHTIAFNTSGKFYDDPLPAESVRPGALSPNGNFFSPQGNSADYFEGFVSGGILNFGSAPVTVYNVTFTGSGYYPYTCSLHAFMGMVGNISAIAMTTIPTQSGTYRSLDITEDVTINVDLVITASRSYVRKGAILNVNSSVVYQGDLVVEQGLLFLDENGQTQMENLLFGTPSTAPAAAPAAKRESAVTTRADDDSSLSSLLPLVLLSGNYGMGSRTCSRTNSNSDLLPLIILSGSGSFNNGDTLLPLLLFTGNSFGSNSRRRCRRRQRARFASGYNILGGGYGYGGYGGGVFFGASNQQADFIGADDEDYSYDDEERRDIEEYYLDEERAFSERGVTPGQLLDGLVVNQFLKKPATLDLSKVNFKPIVVAEKDLTSPQTRALVSRDVANTFVMRCFNSQTDCYFIAAANGTTTPAPPALKRTDPDSVGIGLGVGLGVGIPLLIALLLIAYCCCLRKPAVAAAAVPFAPVTSAETVSKYSYSAYGSSAYGASQYGSGEYGAGESEYGAGESAYGTGESGGDGYSAYGGEEGGYSEL